MKRWLPLILILILAIPLFPAAISRADELDDTTNALIQKQNDLKQAQAALNTAKSKESQLSGTLGGLQQSLNVAIAEINVKQAQLNETMAQLDQQSATLKSQQDIRSQRVRSLYKQLRMQESNQFMSLLSSINLESWTKIIGYHSSAMHDDKSRITDLDQKITSLSKQRDQLQVQASDLSKQKADLEQRASVIRSQINITESQKQGANNQIISLGNDIKGLTAKQQALVQAKIAANAQSSTVGDSDTISTPLPPAPFGASQGGSYAFASYGYPHRVGMSQYGAYGRAQAGQNYQTILHAYFNGVAIGSYPEPDTINVDGFGTMSLEDMYLLGVHEMPRSWSLEALKAQAVVARTFAVKWMNDHPGQSICTTETCQVYHNDNPNSTDQYDQRWYQAVRETRGVVITYGGSPIGAWFSAVDGGYTQTSAQVWGGVTPYTQVTRDYTGSWPAGAYDKDSPWFHKAWGSRTGSGYNPWMSKSEVVDMFNAVLLYEKTGQTTGDDFNLSPPDNGGSSPEQIVAALNNRGVQPIDDFQLITANQNDSTGQTDRINVIGGPRGTTGLAGSDVHKVFNLRSLGNLVLYSSLFDVITQN